MNQTWSKPAERGKIMLSLTISSNMLGLGLAYGAVAMQPGANFFVVSSFSMAGRRDHACLAALGVAAGAASIAALAFGSVQHLDSVIRQLWMLELLYAAVLVRIGVGLLQRARAGRTEAAAPPISRGGSFRTGFVTAATNPVTMVFLIGASAAPAPLGDRCGPGLATLTIFVVAFAWFTSVALLFSTSRVRAAYERARSWANLATGMLFLSIAVGLLVRTWRHVAP